MAPPHKKVRRQKKEYHYQSISMHVPYQDKSFEELRLDQYSMEPPRMFGRSDVNAPTFGITTGLAAREVFATFELCEMILLHVSFAASERQRLDIKAERAHMREWNAGGTWPLTGENLAPHEYIHPEMIDREFLEPISALAPLHLVSKSFDDVLTGSASLQREVFHGNVATAPHPRHTLWWLIRKKIGGLERCMSGYTGEDCEECEGEEENESGDGDDENEAGKKAAREAAKDADRRKARLEAHRDSHQEVNQSVGFNVGPACYYSGTGECNCGEFAFAPPKGSGPESKALAEFVADGAWNSPDASWRRIHLGRPDVGNGQLTVTVGVTYYEAGTLYYDSDWPDREYTRKYDCDESTTLDDFFSWWVSVMHEVDGHAAAAPHENYDRGQYGDIAVTPTLELEAMASPVARQVVEEGKAMQDVQHYDREQHSAKLSPSVSSPRAPFSETEVEPTTVAMGLKT